MAPKKPVNNLSASVSPALLRLAGATMEDERLLPLKTGCPTKDHGTSSAGGLVRAPRVDLHESVPVMSGIAERHVKSLNGFVIY
ncbi:MAG: hypothetical protein PHE83_07450 [Opitutaceae bacterium]|nr:hypothetical protein [Opitutaceae bacterium]